MNNNNNNSTNNNKSFIEQLNQAFEKTEIIPITNEKHNDDEVFISEIIHNAPTTNNISIDDIIQQSIEIEVKKQLNAQNVEYIAQLIENKMNILKLELEQLIKPILKEMLIKML